MTIREISEQIEHETFSPYAQFSDETKGRLRCEEKCDMRTEYQRDRDRILHSKSFRRLKHKTQVFLSPEGDHYRTRLTHTLEVAQIARSVARALRLNEDLTEAIALGHDLGHTPFGHAGERTLEKVSGIGFNHCSQSLRVVDVLEKDGRGLNLTEEVRDGIVNHRTSGNPKTLEGKIVRLSDKIAYINHDIDDAIRGGIFKEDDIPKRFRDELGNTTKERLNTLIRAIVSESQGKSEIKMAGGTEKAMTELRKFMFENLYTSSKAKVEEIKVDKMLTVIFEHYVNNIDKLPEGYLKITEKRNEPKERAICDYISGMSDLYSVKIFEELFVPKSWGV